MGRRDRSRITGNRYAKRVDVADGVDGAPPGGVTLRSLVVPVYLPTVLFGLGQGAIIPVIPLAATGLGASVAVAGLIVGLRGLGTLLFDLPAGWLVERIGERRAMLAATALLAAALVGCVLARHVVALAACVVLIGCSWSVWLLARLTYVTEATDARLRGRALSTLGGANRIGVFLGPFCGAAAVGLAGLDGAFLVHIVAAVLGLVVLAVAADPVELESETQGAPADRSAAGHRPTGVRRAMASGLPGAWAAAGVTITVGLLRASRQALLPLSAQAAGFDDATVSVLFGLSAAIDMTFFYPVGHLSDRFGRRSVAVPCVGLLAAGHVAMAAGSGVALVVAAVLLGVGNGFGSGIVMTLSADFSPDRGRAAFLGAFRLLGDIGTSAGPFVVAALIGAASLGSASLGVGVAGLVAAASIVRVLPETAGRARRAPVGGPGSGPPPTNP